MSTFIIDVPMPSMGATVSELTIINLVVAAGAKVTKGQKLAELESDKSAFDFESPADGTILEVKGSRGDVKSSGQTLFRMETTDQSLQHLAIATAKHDAEATAPAPTTAKTLVWTPRALKLAQEAGLDPATATAIEATGPGGRVSGDDVTKYLASRK
ncbi:MAG: biotin/lipoyl-containing protein [Candidatus Didemnitutus sp.]|nr:biotin/lipoyl-containing protein [Candidatus Didemnitutus sp.]